MIKNPRARGFNAPVRTRVDVDDDDLLPLERANQRVITQGDHQLARHERR